MAISLGIYPIFRQTQMVGVGVTSLDLSAWLFGQEELTSVQREQQILTDASRDEPFTVKDDVWWRV